ncbi:MULTISPECIES: arsenate reductase family protein [unclassified Cobetia]|uniref:arsenate reductase family protein n=1 Tax=unclassified Cobetia TaxID=2609414 RepID=UPI00178C8F64|nr:MULTISPECIES: arsenate reductase family protein [unclassified Cobetia]MBE2169012.1 arsenate reductase family protein [Cobetia sp. 2AS1]MDH2293783.1 arsenate reductase family protein [Cobetia sp. 1AS1]MDH2448846.1 arsenate reductase family protein [Cobetia sp. 2AS]
MSILKLYHNPRCSKSRETLALLTARLEGDAFETVRYLEAPLDREQLEALAARVEGGARALTRENEAEWKALGLVDPSDSQRLDAISATPKLMQRPILDDGTRAVIGRPPEDVLVLLSDA